MSLYQQVKADAPKVYWPFNEAIDGSTCRDASGNGFNGSENGTGAALASTSIVPGHPYSCFNNGDGYFSDGAAGGSNRAALDVGTGDFTMEIWLKITNPTTDYVEIASRDSGATGNGQLLQLNTGTGAPRVWCGGTSLNAGSTRVSDGNLHHLVFRRISGVASVVLDGAQVGSVAAAGSTDVASRPLRVGVVNGAYQRPLGRWAHFAYYTTGLPDDRVMAHYQAGMRGGVVY